MADPNRDMAEFQLSKEGAAFWRLRVTYREVEVRFLFPREEHGTKELWNLMGSIQKIVTAGLREVELVNAMQDIDKEIEELLGDAE